MNIDKHKADIYRQKERVAFDIKDLIEGTEALLRSTASYTGAEIENARANLRSQLESAKQESSRWRSLANARVSQASARADEYAHENPWTLLGVAAIAGLIAGHCLLGGKKRC